MDEHIAANMRRQHKPSSQHPSIKETGLNLGRLIVLLFTDPKAFFDQFRQEFLNVRTGAVILMCLALCWASFQCGTSRGGRNGQDVVPLNIYEAEVSNHWSDVAAERANTRSEHRYAEIYKSEAMAALYSTNADESLELAEKLHETSRNEWTRMIGTNEPSAKELLQHAKEDQELKKLEDRKRAIADGRKTTPPMYYIWAEMFDELRGSLDEVAKTYGQSVDDVHMPLLDEICANQRPERHFTLGTNFEWHCNFLFAPLPFGMEVFCNRPGVDQAHAQLTSSDGKQLSATLKIGGQSLVETNCPVASTSDWVRIVHRIVKLMIE